MPGEYQEEIPSRSPRLLPSPACYHGNTLSSLCPLRQPDAQAQLPWGLACPPPLETGRLIGRCWTMTVPHWGRKEGLLPLDALWNGVAGDGQHPEEQVFYKRTATEGAEDNS